MTARRQRAGDLPAETTALIGRRPELTEVHRLLTVARLVTLTGVGGVGKTRLALRAAYEAQPAFRDGVWWVELSPLRHGSLLAHTIAEALPLGDQTTRPMIEVLVEYLAGRELLLVLDTCEHLVDECALVAEALLREAPGVRILVTTRRPLGVVGERLLTVAPLSVPEKDSGGRNGRGVAGEADAVALLAARAAEVVPGFAVTAANRPDLVRLCRRLDGLPLAIELAAARLRELSVAELAARLEDRFAVLGDTDTVVSDAEPPWHQALRTAIGWSHELCTPAERLAWARLSVFAGGFDAEAARQVCADGILPAGDVPGLLNALTDKSLLIRQPATGGERYRMLDTIREYGAGWLRGLGEEDALRRRHRDHYLRLARAGDAAWIGPDQYAWYDRTTAEHDNLRAALEYSLAVRDGPGDHAALELAGALWFFWHGCGFTKEGQHYLDRALAADTAPSPARVKALYACSQLLLYLGDLPGIEDRTAACAALAARFGDAERSLATAADLRLAVLRGDTAQTLSLAEKLLAAPWRQRPPAFLPLIALVMGAHAHVTAGRFEQAMAMLDELSAVCEGHGERCVRAWGDLVRSQAELARGRPRAAQEYARAALRVKHRLHDGTGSGMALDVLAQAGAALGHSRHAARLLGLALQVWDTLGRPQAGVPALITARRACERQVRAALGDRPYETAFRAGYHADLDTGIAGVLGDRLPLAPPPPHEPAG
ncbi:LuxR family transcriptional regulator [Streptomyces sp. Ru73]|uniref:ATP-binding protein n=1 Tax=Streptomyces sp. Ru73 TaxID=2080748 RepID=UPI000CDD3437|nr:NB-ARC domain-containing protein [Streptomyces sp. Ru73]POX36529.1 LuxR family transcriptional regulator [Streptomyces sp. Ru73]